MINFAGWKKGNSSSGIAYTRFGKNVIYVSKMGDALRVHTTFVKDTCKMVRGEKVLMIGV